MAISTFTGRTIIWDFARYEIARRPLLGWGYQSFWLVGPDAPSIVDAPGWVKDMPNAHNGYYGYDAGDRLRWLCFAHDLHRRNTSRHWTHGRPRPRRAWLVLSLALFVIFYNFLESLWMRGFEFLWVMFLIVAAEAGRHWRSSAPAYGPKSCQDQALRFPHDAASVLDSQGKEGKNSGFRRSQDAAIAIGDEEIVMCGLGQRVIRILGGPLM